MYFAGFWALRSTATERESCILQGFERFEAIKQSVNHVFCRLLSASKQWNRAWITYFARLWAFRSIKTRRESRILRGFELFEALKHCVNHVFCKVLRGSCKRGRCKGGAKGWPKIFVCGFWEFKMEVLERALGRSGEAQISWGEKKLPKGYFSQFFFVRLDAF